jgi:hypothetical protein
VHETAQSQLIPKQSPNPADAGQKRSVLDESHARTRAPGARHQLVCNHDHSRAFPIALALESIGRKRCSGLFCRVVKLLQ